MKLTFIILILTLTINLCYGELGWKIINLKKTMTNERIIYTGKVIWVKNNQPAKVRIMLIGTLTSTPYDETITSYNGEFQLFTSKEVTSPLFLIQPINKRILLIPPKIIL